MKWILIVIMASQLSTVEFTSEESCLRELNSIQQARIHKQRATYIGGEYYVGEPLPIEYIQCVEDKKDDTPKPGQYVCINGTCGYFSGPYKGE